MTSGRVLLILAVRYDWSLLQLDIKNAFLYGDLEEVVYVVQPPGFVTREGKVCHLRMVFYGLKQSPRA